MDQKAILANIITLLTQANAAAPLVIGGITAISSIINGITGQRGPTLLELADLVEAQLTENDDQLRAEIVRLRQIVATPVGSAVHPSAGVPTAPAAPVSTMGPSAIKPSVVGG